LHQAIFADPGFRDGGVVDPKFMENFLAEKKLNTRNKIEQTDSLLIIQSLSIYEKSFFTRSISFGEFLQRGRLAGWEWVTGISAWAGITAIGGLERHLGW